MKVFIIASLTADGFLGRSADDFAMDWTSDKKSFIKLTKRAGVVVMGAKTFGTLLAAKRRMPGRKMIIYSRNKDIYPHGYRQDPTEVTSEPPAELVKRIAKEGYTELAICGGMSIYDLFLSAGVVDELYLTVEPKIFGQGINLFSNSHNVDLKFVGFKKVSENAIRLHYEVIKS